MVIFLLMFLKDFASFLDELLGSITLTITEVIYFTEYETKPKLVIFAHVF